MVMVTASLIWDGTGSFLLRHLSYGRVRVWVRFLEKASVRARIKDKKSMSRDNRL